jgi:hypothetical protein
MHCPPFVVILNLENKRCCKPKIAAIGQPNDTKHGYLKEDETYSNNTTKSCSNSKTIPFFKA